MKKILNITLRLFAVCLITVAALAGVNELTKAKIAENEQATLQAALEQLVPAEEYSNTDFEQIKDSQAFLSADFKATVQDAYVAGTGTEIKGYVVVLDSKGYGGEVRVNVGISPQGEVLGVIISKHSETPGLGAKADNAGFLEQYKGKKGSVTLNDIDAISGATITSRAVTNAVDTALKFTDEFLKKA